MNNIWTKEELMFVLYLYLRRNDGYFLQMEELEQHINMMNKYSNKNRTYDSIILRLANYKYLDTGKGMSHTGKSLEIWNEYCNDLDSLQENYQRIMLPFNIRKKELMKMGSEKGFLTFEELVDCLKGLEVSEKEIDDLYNALNIEKIEVISNDDLKINVNNILEEHLANKGYRLAENEKIIYINLFNSLGELVNNKLTYKDIIEKYDEISDQMKVLPNEDKIRVPYYDLERMFEGILSKEEKEYFLFAIWYGECVTIADVTASKTVFKNGNTELTTAEAIKNLKEIYYKDDLHYNMFHFNEKEELHIKGDFGYSKANPVKATSINNSYVYLKKLKTSKGKKIDYRRIGSVDLDGFDKPIDEYLIYENLLFGRKKQIGNIYINAYSNENSNEVPNGLII